MANEELKRMLEELRTKRPMLGMDLAETVSEIQAFIEALLDYRVVSEETEEEKTLRQLKNKLDTMRSPDHVFMNNDNSFVFSNLAQPESGQMLGPPVLLPETLFYGKPTEAFSTGTTLTLDPCSREGTDNEETNQTAYLQADKSSYTMQDSTTIPVTEIVPFVLGLDENYYVLGRPKVVMTAFQVVTASQLLQAKYRDDWGLFCGTESAWITIHTGDVCA